MFLLKKIINVTIFKHLIVDNVMADVLAKDLAILDDESIFIEL